MVMLFVNSCFAGHKVLVTAELSIFKLGWM